jgi:putative ABC transport system substrate-binding protein
VEAGARALGALVVLLLATSLIAGAQPTGKIYRIGVIQTTSPREVEHVNKALDDALRQLGYVQGQHYVMERRFADGRQERLPALAAELVRLKVDVIVTGSNPVIAAVKQATSTIPVVMAVSRDPVGAGFIASLARPGGNITGLANDPTPEIQGKTSNFSGKPCRDCLASRSCGIPSIPARRNTAMPSKVEPGDSG